MLGLTLVRDGNDDGTVAGASFCLGLTLSLGHDLSFTFRLSLSLSLSLNLELGGIGLNLVRLCLYLCLCLGFRLSKKHTSLVHHGVRLGSRKGR